MIKKVKKIIKKQQEKEKNRKKKRLLNTTIRTIPYEKFLEDDITSLGNNLYSKTYSFSKIDYTIFDKESKEEFITKYMGFLNSLDDKFVNVQISLINEKLDKAEYYKKISNNFDDDLNEIRKQYNEIIVKKIEESQNKELIQTKLYFTVTIEQNTFERVKTLFKSYDKSIYESFKRLNGAKLTVVSNYEKTKLLSSIYRSKTTWDKNKNKEDFTYSLMEEKSVIASDFLKINPNTLESNEKVFKSYFIRELPSFISDYFITEVMSLPMEMIFTININPINSAKAVKIINNKLTGLNASKLTKEQKAYANNYNPEIVTKQLDEDIENTKEYSKDMVKNDQKLFQINTLITLISNEDKLVSDEELLQDVLNKNLCEIANASFQQIDCFNSAIPIGNNKMPIRRYINSNGLAGFVPFNLKEYLDLKGFPYGLDISGNIIMLDRKKLNNYNGFILGSSGFGKSFSAKQEILNIILNTNDHVIVIDPNREFKYLLEILGGINIDISAMSKNHINLMDMGKHYSSDGASPLRAKADFILNICELLLGTDYPLLPEAKSIIDRCVNNIFKEYLKDYDSNKIPTLKDLYLELLNDKLDEELSKSLALGLEMYAIGSQDVFAKKTNVDINNRIVNFDIKDLGSSMQTLGLTVVLDFIRNRVTENEKEGRATWIFIDEIHLLLKNKHSLENLETMYKTIRKFGGLPTGITQNITDLTHTKEASTMLKNSEFVKILSQGKGDRDILCDLFGLSEVHESCIKNADKGSGLIIYGSDIIPFTDKFPESSPIYDYINTNPYKDVG